MSSNQAYGEAQVTSSALQAQIKVNLGCGGAWQVPGWFGIDQRSTSRIWQDSNEPRFIDFDVKKGLPFATNSVDVIFSSHTLEHFTYEEAIALLFEAYRVLKIGSPLCLIVPDMDLYIQNYVQRNTEFLSTPEIIGGKPRDNLADNFLMNFYSDPSFNNTCHKYGYNFENLASNLRLVGFDDVQRVKFHEFSYWPELNADEFKSPIKNIERFSLTVQCRKLSFDQFFRDRPLFREAQKYSRFKENEQQLAQQLNAALLLQEGLTAQYSGVVTQRDSLRTELVELSAMARRTGLELEQRTADIERLSTELQSRSSAIEKFNTDAIRHTNQIKWLENELQQRKKNLVDIEASSGKRLQELHQTNAETYRALEKEITDHHRQAALSNKEWESTLARETRARSTIRRIVQEASAQLHTQSTAKPPLRSRMRLRIAPDSSSVDPLANIREVIAQSGLFEATWYVQQYPDIAQSGMDPLAHYLQHGATEGRNPGPLFDGGWYVAGNPAIGITGVNPLAHYLQYGAQEGGDPHPLFSSAWYGTQHPEVVQAGINLLSHYVRHGAAEGRDPHPLFDSDWYLKRYPDVAEAGVNPLAHYVQYGIIDSRDPHPLFDNGWYLTEYPELAAMGISPLAHYLQQDDGSRFNPNSLFNGAWYLTKYPDVARSGMRPLLHFIRHGSEELRDPGPLFDSRWYSEQYPDVSRSGINLLAHYLEQDATTRYNPNPVFDGLWYITQYPDVAKSGLKPIVHYLRYGAKEGRNPGPNFDSNGYLRQYPDVLEAGMNPLEHYLRHGAAEGRRPVPAGRENRPTSDMQKVIARSSSDPLIDYAASSTRYSPLISVLIPTFNTPVRFLKEVVQSIQEQTYSKWELCIVDDGSTDQDCLDLLKEITQSDSKIRVHLCAANEGIAAASQQALQMATGEFVAFVDHDDILAPNALGEIVHCLRQDPTISMIYTDHAMMDEDGNLLSPALKSSWSPELFLSTNYLVHFKVIRRSFVHELGGFADTIHIAQDIGLSCKICDKETAVHHLPKALYYWRVHKGSVTIGTSAKPEIELAALRTYNNLLKGRGIEAQLVWPDYFRTRKIGAYKIDFSNKARLKLAVIVPFEGAFDYTKFRSHFQKTDLLPLPSLHLISLGRPPRIQDDHLPEVHTAETQEAFDRIIEQIECEVLVFLSPNALTLSSSWLKELVGYLSISPQIGAVGGKVLNAQLHVSSGGLLLLNEITPICAGMPDESDGYWFNGRIASNVEAVSSRLLATPKSTYFKVGGMPFFKYRDAAGVAYGLQLRAHGYRVVYNPWSKIVDPNPEFIPEGLGRMLSDAFGPAAKHDRYYHPFYSRDTPYVLI